VNKEKEALKIINQISRLHKKAAPNEQKLDDEDTKQQTETTLTTEKVSAVYLISRPGIALTTAILSLNWLVVDFCYYGLSLHSVNLAGNIFTNFVLSAAVEIPAVVLGT